MAKKEKKPAHEIIVKRIIDDFDAKEKQNKLLRFRDDGTITTIINHHYCREIKILLGILKEMIIPDTAESLKQLIGSVDLSKLDSPASVEPIVQQLKKLQS